MKASIFIPTKNAGPSFRKTLDAIFSQKEKDFEVIVVDSGSTDETLSILSKYSVKLYQILPTEFGHGKTRNLALKYAKGEFIIFLTQDAKPNNAFWLTHLLEACGRKNVAGSYSRQIPQPGAKVTEDFFYLHHFPNFEIVRILRSGEAPTLNHTFFSNASSCLRKDILSAFPFREDLIMCEDQGFALEVLKAGYKTVYANKSEVIHSHNYGFFETIRRYFDTAYAFKKILGKNFSARRVGVHYIFKEFYFVISKDSLKIFLITLNNVAKISGTSLGLVAEKLPKNIKKRLSMHSYHFDN